MDLDSFWPASWLALEPWRGALAAFGVALAWAGLLRSLNRRDLAVLGTGLGLAAGWALELGVPFASPRQLAERLPLLAAAAFAAALTLSSLAAGRAWAAALGAGLCLAAGAWWLAGAPMTPPDLRRALVPVLALAAAAAVASLELRSPARAVVAFAFLLAATAILRPAGPWSALAAAGLAAALGALPAAGGSPPPSTATSSALPAALPAALALTGLAAGPVLSRGAAPDWTAGAAPFAALAFGPALAGRLGGGAAGTVVGWTAAGGVPLLFTWLLAGRPG